MARRSLHPSEETILEDVGDGAWVNDDDGDGPAVSRPWHGKSSLIQLSCASGHAGPKRRSHLGLRSNTQVPNVGASCGDARPPDLSFLGLERLLFRGMDGNTTSSCHAGDAAAAWG